MLIALKDKYGILYGVIPRGWDDRCSWSNVYVPGVQLKQKIPRTGTTLEDLKIENKGQSETLENMEGMIIKLIDRWNKSDETRDRRHEKLVEELNDQSAILMEIKGNLSRLNGKH